MEVVQAGVVLAQGVNAGDATVYRCTCDLSVNRSFSGTRPICRKNQHQLVMIESFALLLYNNPIAGCHWFRA